MTRFKNKEEFEKFLDTAMFCVCGKLLTGLHEMYCRKIQILKIKFIGKQDESDFVKVPKVTD